MNPSTEDVLKRLQSQCEKYFVFPNNKKYYSETNQARDLTEDKNIIVIPTKTIPRELPH